MNTHENFTDYEKTHHIINPLPDAEFRAIPGSKATPAECRKSGAVEANAFAYEDRLPDSVERLYLNQKYFSGQFQPAPGFPGRVAAG